MNAMNLLAAVSNLNKSISNNLMTISDYQGKMSEWDLLPDSEKPQDIDTGKPIDISDVHGILEGITNETIALFDTVSSMSRALFESIPEKEIVIYTQD